MALHYVSNTDPEVAAVIDAELERQRGTIELIASENVASLSVMEAMGSVLTNKYAEGYPGKRYYGGCEKVDLVEDLARERAKKLYGPASAPRSSMDALLPTCSPILVLRRTLPRTRPSSIQATRCSV